MNNNKKVILQWVTVSSDENMAVKLLKNKGYKVCRKKVFPTRRTTLAKRTQLLQLLKWNRGMTGKEIMCRFGSYPIADLNCLMEEGLILKKRIMIPRKNPVGTVKHNTGIQYFAK